MQSESTIATKDTDSNKRSKASIKNSPDKNETINHPIDPLELYLIFI